MDKKAASYFIRRVHASDWTKNFSRQTSLCHSQMSVWYSRNTDVWIWSMPSKATNTKFAKHCTS